VLPQSLNPYAYGLNGPLAYVDADGMQALPVPSPGTLQGMVSLQVIQGGVSSSPGMLALMGAAPALIGIAMLDSPVVPIMDGVAAVAALGIYSAAESMGQQSAPDPQLGQPIEPVPPLQDGKSLQVDEDDFDCTNGNTNPDWEEIARVLRDAAASEGYFGIGSSSRELADKAGRAWVGNGYRVSSDGKAWVSADGLKQYRSPSYKSKRGMTQANFESRLVPKGGWRSNAHLDIIDPCP
jgi:hypothetical protein